MTATQAAGRAKRHGNKVQVKVRLPKHVKARLDAIAANAGVSLSTVIQVALGLAVNEWKSTRECPDCDGAGRTGQATACGTCGSTGRVRD